MLTQLLHKLDPERAHRLAIRGLGLSLVPQQRNDRWPRLKTTLATLVLPNPLGLAAGFDKNAEAIAGLQKLGFGWVEVGTITPKPQTGNPKPRIFRLPSDRALINRLGFNNEGLEAATRRLAQRNPDDGIIGANIGANRDAEDPVEDYATCLAALYGYADYFTINVSSPNTPGLRDLQGRERLQRLLGTLIERRDGLRTGGSRKPLFLKIAPDLTAEDERDVAEVALSLGIDGLIIANTTIARPDDLRGSARGEAGGLSGRPLLDRSTAQIGRFHALTGGKLPLIGVGGIESGEGAFAKIRAGASALQMYTGFIYGGPRLIPTILTKLDRLLETEGFASLAEAVGTAPVDVPCRAGLTKPVVPA
ncbi:MAG: quinone-dependent dihydroorotate dehydrogenase [Pseudomonadota bacterium]